MKRRAFITSTFTSIAAAQFLGTSKLLAEGTPRSPLQATGNLLRFPRTWDGVSDIDVIGDTVQIWTGTDTQVITMGGYPGVTINKRTGDWLNVQFNNHLSKNTAIHWHGLDVPSDMDGHPKDEFATGLSRTYQFRVNDRAGMYFYHSHAHMHSGDQVFNGLYGLLRVTDSEEEALGLPSGEFEIPVVIQDVRIDSQSQLSYSPSMMDWMEGVLGNIILINGTPEAYTTVKRGTYRLRVVNASNARLYKLAFTDGRAFQIIGSDGGLLASPATTTSLRLAPAERYDILADFSQLSVGESVSLVSLAYSPPGGHMGNVQYPQGKAFELVRFDVVDGDATVYSAPSTLSTIDRYDNMFAVRTRRFDLQTQIMGDKHTINGALFEMDRIDLNVKAGEFEIWEFVNSDFGKVHPMHIHGGQFQILMRNGSANVPAWERGWKDTFIVSPGERVQVGVRFNNYAGVFLVHCHILEHEDEGMMLNFEVSDSTSVDEVQSSAFQTWYSPANDAVILLGRYSSNNTLCNIVDGKGRVVLTHSIAPGNAVDAHIPAQSLAQGTYTVCLGSEQYRIFVIR